MALSIEKQYRKISGRGAVKYEFPGLGVADRWAVSGAFTGVT
jgi:hypothetical protein